MIGDGRLPVDQRTPAERALREQNLRDRLEWAERKVRSGWCRASCVTAGGPGAFLAASIFVWDGGEWPILAWPVLLWLVFVSGWAWWILRRDRRERRELEEALRRLALQDPTGSRVHSQKIAWKLRTRSGAES